MGTGIGTGLQRERHADTAQANPSLEQRKGTENRAEAQRGLQRKERFEELLKLEGGQFLGDPPESKSVRFVFEGKGDYVITRTNEGYKLSAVRIIDKENHVNFSDYYFDKSGAFIEKIRTSSSNEKSAPDNSKTALREVDHLLPQFGKHNAKWHDKDSQDFVKDLQRKEKFEKLIKSSLSEGFGETATSKNSAEFELSKNRSCSIKRTDAGYTFEIARQIDKEHSNVVRYFFDKDGTFLAKVKVSATGEQYAAENNKTVLGEVDRIVPQLGSHNEKLRKALFR